MILPTTADDRRTTMSEREQTEPTGRLVVISGPSGVGKSTIVRQVLKRIEATLVVSATTRAPRPGERDGRDYHFVDVGTFRRMIADDGLLEWAEVFGNYYGTPAEPAREALARGETVLLEIDVQGGIQIAREHPGALGVLITPPDPETLVRRLNGRGTDAAGVIAKRLAKAQAELDMARESGAYAYEVANDDLTEAVERVVAILDKETESQ